MKQSIKRFFALATAVFCLCPYMNISNVLAESSGVVYFDENGDSSEVSGARDSAVTISVVPSKDSVNVGDDFYVDFIIKNNTGFAAFGFTVGFDTNIILPVKGNESEMDSVAQVTYAGGRAAVDTNGINSAIDISEYKKPFFYTNFLLEAGDIATTDDNGILFRVNFKAVGKGTANIELYDRLGTILCDNYGENIPTYVENASISVTAGSSDTDENEDNTVTTETADKESTISDDDINNMKTTEDDTDSEDVTESTSNEVQTNKIDDENGFKINLPKDMLQVKSFYDTEDVPWAEGSINKLSSLGIINGVADGIFNSKAYTYRADFVIVISRLLGLDADFDNTFSDVENSAYYAKAVSMASGIGIVKGSDGMFMPKNNITRQDVMVILSRVLDMAGKNNKASESVLRGFADKEDISPYAVSAVSDLVNLGIVNGDDNGRLNPKGFINRAEMAVIIDKVYDVLNN